MWKVVTMGRLTSLCSLNIGNSNSWLAHTNTANTKFHHICPCSHHSLVGERHTWKLTLRNPLNIHKLNKQFESTHQLRATWATSQRPMTMKLWEPKRKCPKAVPSHLQNHAVQSQILKCSVKLCERTLNQMLFQWLSIYTGPHTW